jgi:DNA-binding LacI/PurR family transcriptional regulator
MTHEAVVVSPGLKIWTTCRPAACAALMCEIGLLARVTYQPLAWPGGRNTILVPVRGSYRSKSVRLADTLAEQIIARRWSEGAWMPTEAALVVEHSAARLTVRRAMSLLISRGLVRQIPHRGIVVGQRAVAPAVRRRRAQPVEPAAALTFVVVQSMAPDEGVVQIQLGIESYCREAGIAWRIIAGADDPDQPFRLLEDPAAIGASGVIVLPYPGDEHKALLEGLHQRGVPLVCVERRSATLQVPSVEIDNRNGMYRMVQHLLERWRRPVWYLGLTSAHRTDTERYEGYCLAMRDAGYGAMIQERTLLHGMSTADPRYWHVEDPWRQGYEIGQQLLQRGESFLSVACQKDHIAWGLYRAAAERGIVVGHQLVITGFDDQSIAARLDPPLTTVHQPFYEKGRKAAWLVHRRIQQAVTGAVQVVVPTELVLRGSA